MRFICCQREEKQVVTHTSSRVTVTGVPTDEAEFEDDESTVGY